MSGHQAHRGADTDIASAGVHGDEAAEQGFGRGAQESLGDLDRGGVLGERRGRRGHHHAGGEVAGAGHFHPSQEGFAGNDANRRPALHDGQGQRTGFSDEPVQHSLAGAVGGDRFAAVDQVGKRVHGAPEIPNWAITMAQAACEDVKRCRYVQPNLQPTRERGRRRRLQTRKGRAGRNRRALLEVRC